MVEISPKIEEPTEAMKARGTLVFLEIGLRLFVFPKIGVCFSKLREFPKLLKLEFMEYTPTARGTEDSLSSTLF